MSPPRVVHLKREPYDVRIDRQTHWGNPFVVGKHGTREQVIAKYREWILSEPSVVAMAQRELRGKVLGCWCAPKACHGDVLVEIANKEVWWCAGCSRYHVDQSTDLSACTTCSCGHHERYHFNDGRGAIVCRYADDCGCSRPAQGKDGERG